MWNDNRARNPDEIHCSVTIELLPDFDHPYEYGNLNFLQCFVRNNNTTITTDVITSNLNFYTVKTSVI